MQAILEGKLGFFVLVIFLVMILCGLLIQHIVKKMRWEISMAEYEMERGPIEEAPKPPPEEKLIPGYTMLTHEDYEEIEKLVKQDLMKEMEQPS